ncbi:DUF397 domain-containing protein [Kitasatospora sp. NPDC059160]|uniref:DUF397 domain-containing protein n=1 Tax=Kitasatospora sp. NPDC059160 TaxID=3346748 RepID=UPI00369F3D07
MTETDWFKSSYCDDKEFACVEIRVVGPGAVAVRDSTDPDGPVLAFPAESWTAFLRMAGDSGQLHV